MKRIFDISLSLFSIFILLPIGLLIYILIVMDSGKPVFYKQTRVGKNWKPFVIFKFRTLRESLDVDSPGCTPEHDIRITRLGRPLRKYKLDEIPQLWNVLKGDMSFVGPRPELLKFAQSYKDIFDKILTVSPGITDLASIKYRNESRLLDDSDSPEDRYVKVILPEKLKYNLKCLEKHSVTGDFQLISMTIYLLLVKITE